MPKNEFENKNILVTGGTGSIGVEIVKQLMTFRPNVIRIFARHEDRHYRVMHELHVEEPRSNDVLRFMVGDIRDKDRLRMAMDGIDVVFHAAALKHVPICEYNPFEAVKTNIIGTQNVIEVARESAVDRVIGISTDKVAEPESVLGVSKLMAEKLFLATFFYRGDKKTKFACVRFGNVLGSRGSILPVIKKQVLEKGAVTVTDQEMTRFVMTIPQAVNLVLRTAELMQGQEVFVLKMPSVKLKDLVAAAISVYAPMASRRPSDIPIQIVGKRNGEKDHEKLLADYELAHALETTDLYILTPFENVDGLAYNRVYPGAVKVSTHDKSFLSKHAPRLSQRELTALLKELTIHEG